MLHSVFQFQLELGLLHGRCVARPVRAAGGFVVVVGSGKGGVHTSHMVRLADRTPRVKHALHVLSNGLCGVT